MVLFALTELVLKSTIWILSGTYKLGYRMYYGRQKTTEEILLEKLAELHNENKQQKDQMMKLQYKLDEFIDHDYDE